MLKRTGQYRVLIVGVGSIGERHLRCFLKTGRATVGIVETNDRLCMDVADRYGIQQVYPTLEHAMRSHWDAAVIATPAPTHVRIAQTLASAGTHLLIEKPLATTMQGVDDLQADLSRRGLVGMVGYTQRSNPIIARLREIVKSGELGAPLQMIVIAGQHFPTFRPAYRDVYYAQRSSGGGAVQDALTHLLNAGEWILGPITRVSADAAHLALDGVNVEDTAHVIARHGRIMASYAMNQHQTPNETTITTVCRSGTVRAELHEMRVRVMRNPGEPWADESIRIADRDDLYVAQANAFLNCMERGDAPLCSISEAAQTLRVTLEILRQIDRSAAGNVEAPGVSAPSLPPAPSLTH